MNGILQQPRWVGAVLASSATDLVARFALASAYIVGGLVKLTDFPGAVAEQGHFGMNPPAFWAVLTILVELGGAALFLTRRWVWLGAGVLGAFTALASVVANPFWTMEAPDRFAATNAFFEHLGLIGGFALAAHTIAMQGVEANFRF